MTHFLLIRHASHDLLGRALAGRMPGVPVISHGDILRAVVAHYIGSSLDLLHRFEIAPASVTTLRVTEHGATLLCLNEVVAVTANALSLDSGALADAAAGPVA
jgi:broad specificity phosphatase PhoE